MRACLRSIACVVALLGSGCAPAIYAFNQGPASRAVERARQADAETRAPYEYYTAISYLSKAREEAGESSYQDAIEHARIAEDAANQAVERSRAVMRETGR